MWQRFRCSIRGLQPLKWKKRTDRFSTKQVVACTQKRGFLHQPPSQLWSLRLPFLRPLISCKKSQVRRGGNSSAHSSWLTRRCLCPAATYTFPPSNCAGWVESAANVPTEVIAHRALYLYRNLCRPWHWTLSWLDRAREARSASEEGEMFTYFE